MDTVEHEPSPALQAVREFLEHRGVAHEVVEHHETLSARAEAQAAGVDPHEAAKTLALRDHDAYRLAVVPASRRLDLNRARHALGASRHLRLATEPEMARDLSAYDVGALPPLGPQLPLVEVVDVRLLYHERILCAAGDHRHSLLIDPRDLLRVTEPRVADIVEHDEEGRSRYRELPHV